MAGGWSAWRNEPPSPRSGPGLAPCRARSPPGAARGRRRVARDDGGADPAAHVESPDHRHAARTRRANEVVQDLVGGLLEEVSFVAKRPQVELQGLELD